MFPDFDEDEDHLKDLVSWGLPGYSFSKGESFAMPATKKKAPAKKAGARKTNKGTSKTK